MKTQERSVVVMHPWKRRENFERREKADSDQRPHEKVPDDRPIRLGEKRFIVVTLKKGC